MIGCLTETTKCVVAEPLVRGCTRFALSWWGGACFRDGWTNLNQTWYGGTFCDSIQDFNPTSPPGGSAPPQRENFVLWTNLDQILYGDTFSNLL